MKGRVSQGRAAEASEGFDGGCRTIRRLLQRVLSGLGAGGWGHAQVEYEDLTVLISFSSSPHIPLILPYPLFHLFLLPSSSSPSLFPCVFSSVTTLID